MEPGAPVTVLPGIGPALAVKLAACGVRCVEDLVWLVPRRYDDARAVRGLADGLARADGAPARATLEGVVASCRPHRRGRRRWLDLRLRDEQAPPAFVVIRFFGAHGSMAARFPVGACVTVSGRLSRRGAVWEMANPDVLGVESPGGGEAGPTAGILPRYGEVPGVAPARLARACEAALACVDAIDDAVPAAVAARLALPVLAETLRTLHRPPASLSVEEVAALDDGTSPWHRRLVFGELLLLGLAIARRRQARRLHKGVGCPLRAGHGARLSGALPFALTGAQERAIATIAADLAAATPMSRLLQGDVGSGKTAVAFAAALQVIDAGHQVALMAPTEILAEQHHAVIAGYCAAAGVRCALLTASTPRGLRAELTAGLADGTVPLVVGTHALLSEGVQFGSLGLAIVDEQHRFGVAQRVGLRAKTRTEPHLLVMTATPIPRTLALTAYGDLDVTVLDELPPGRQSPATQVLAGARGRSRALALVRGRLAAGERVYVVCPLIEPTDDPVRGGLADATSTAAALADQLAPVGVGLVHGRMSSGERDEVMGRFRDGRLQVLVATTVIEVGVDVPEATVMLIEDAQQFGLAQLHQLRGRIGRGGGASWCLLLTSGRKTEAGRRRLEVMSETADGFRIAEEDLALRGPGELLGTRQAGVPQLRFGDLRQHGALLVQARSEADRILASDPDLSRPEHAATRRALERQLANAEVYGEESG